MTPVRLHPANQRKRWGAKPEAKETLRRLYARSAAGYFASEMLLQRKEETMKKSTKKLARHLTALFAALAVGLGTLPAAAFAADAPEPIPEQPAIVGVESAQEEGQSDAVGTDAVGTDAVGTDTAGTGETGTGETETGETGTDETETGGTGTDETGTDETETGGTGTDETGTDETTPSEDAVLPTEPATQPEQPEETPAAGEAPDAEEIPAEVEAFLNAVAKIPADITPDNAEEAAELIYGEVSEAYEALLGTEYEGRADVQEAAALYAAAIEAVDAALDMESTHYLASIPGVTPADRFYDKGKEVAQLYVGTYPNNPVYSYDNPATSIEVKVGESGFEQYLYTKSAICHCGNVLVEVTPDWIAVDSNRKLTNSDSSIIEDLSWNLAGYVAEDASDSGYAGYPALRLNVVGAKPGNTQIKAQVYQNYYYYYTRQQCKRCGQPYSEISFKGKWIEDTQTLNVKVNADYVLNYDTNGGSPIPSPTKQTVAKTSADLAVTTTVPDKAGFKFVGWSENAHPTENDRIFKAGDKVTLNWEEGKGSQENPVSKTLYAIWKEEGDNTPDAPEKTDLYGILKDFVQVKCVSEGNDLPHEPKSYCTLTNANEVTIGKVESKIDASDGNTYYYCDVTLHGKEYVKFYGMEPDFGTGVKHTIKLAEGEKADQIITLKWNADAEKWQSGSPKGTILATFKAVCVEPKYAVQWIDAANQAVLKSENRTGTVGTAVTVNESDKAYPGYTYVGDEDARNVLSATLEESGTVLKLYFTKDTENPGPGPDEPGKDQYNVTYKWTGLPENHNETLPEGGKYEEGAEVTVDVSYSANKEVVIGEKTYVFSGWSTSDADIENGKFTMPNKDVTLIGTWTEKAENPGPGPDEPGKDQYNVTYKWTGLPENHNETLPEGGKYEEGETVTVDTSFVKGQEVIVGGKTYVFSGWDQTGSFAMPAEDVTINGSWSEKPVTPTPGPDPVDPTPGEPDDPTPPSGGYVPRPRPVTPPVVDVPEIDVPLVETPVVEFVEPEVPLTEAPELPEAEVPEEDVPLADIPKTGDSGLSLWAMLAAFSLAGILALGRKLRTK